MTTQIVLDVKKMQEEGRKTFAMGVVLAGAALFKIDLAGAGPWSIGFVILGLLLIAAGINYERMGSRLEKEALTQKSS